MSPETLRVFIDGASKGNPGPGGAGIYIEASDGRPLKKYCKAIARCTNNVAEATALEAGLRVAHGLGAARVEVFTDSQLLARQFSGRYRVRDSALKVFWERIRRLAADFESISIRHIPRWQNVQADRLANLGAQKARRRA